MIKCRPEYRDLGWFREEFPDVPIMACLDSEDPSRSLAAMSPIHHKMEALEAWKTGNLPQQLVVYTYTVDDGMPVLFR